MSGNEAKTRKDIIDKRLQIAGWNVNDFTHVVEEFDISVQLRKGVDESTIKSYSKKLKHYYLFGKCNTALFVTKGILCLNIKPFIV